MKLDTNQEYRATVSDLAYTLGLTERRIQQLESEGIVNQLERGAYDLIESVRAYCEFIRQESRGSVASKEERAERTKLTRAKRRLQELRTGELEGKLVRTEYLEKQDFEIAMILADTLQTIPDRIAPLLAAEQDANACYKLLDAELVAARENCVKKMEQSRRTIVDCKAAGNG